LINRHQQAISFYQFVEDLLQDVLGVRRVGHPPADEIAQPGSFLRDDLGDLPILVVEALLGHRACARQLIHPLL